MEIFFFATRGDMLAGLNEIDSVRNLNYVRCGGHDSQKVNILNSGRAIPNLGFNATGDHQSESYLVQAQSTPIQIREIELSVGDVRYLVDQMLNDTSIVFWPGGIYDNDHFICGHIATISSSDISLELYKFFSTTFIKGFKKFGRYYVGPEALTLSEKMRFITININQPKEYDFPFQSKRIEDNNVS